MNSTPNSQKATNINATRWGNLTRECRGYETRVVGTSQLQRWVLGVLPTGLTAADGRRMYVFEGMLISVTGNGSAHFETAKTVLNG